jgi:hypothetical protein
MTKFPGVLTLRPNYRLSKPASRKKGLTVALELEPVKGQSRRTPALWLLLSLCLLLPAPALYAGPAVQAWAQHYAGASGIKVAVDPQGNVVVAAQLSGWHGLIIKYSGAGVPLWTNIWGTFPTVVEDMALDNSGNVYVTGYWDLGMGQYPEYETGAYSSQGIPLWTNFYNGPADLGDYATGVAADSSGNVYVTGYAWRNEALRSCATLAYSSVGTPLWTNLYSGGSLSAITDCLTAALALDDAGNVYVIAYTDEATEGPAWGYALVAYSSTGATRWVNSCNGCEIFPPVIVAASHSGNVYDIMGAYCGGGYLTSAYSSGGAFLWANQDVAPCDSEAYANAIAVGSNSNVYVTGCYGGGATGYDYLTAAYSSLGTLLWTNRYNGPGNSNDCAQALAVGSSGNVYVTGYSWGTNSSYDYLTIAYSSNGVPRWTNSFNEAGGSQACALAVDANDNVYVTGQSAGECVTIKYMPPPAIAFSAIAVLPGPTCLLTLAAPTNVAYRLDASTDLMNWQTLTNFPALPVTTVQYTDALAAGFACRFYRTVWSP